MEKKILHAYRNDKLTMEKRLAGISHLAILGKIVRRCLRVTERAAQSQESTPDKNQPPVKGRYFVYEETPESLWEKGVILPSNYSRS